MLQTVPLVTSMECNISKSRCEAFTTTSNVVDSGVLPLNISTTLKVTIHPCLQLHLGQPGVSAYANTTTLPLFEIHGDEGAECEQTPESSKREPQKSKIPNSNGCFNKAPAASKCCEDIGAVYIPSGIDLSVLMLDSWYNEQNTSTYYIQPQ